MDDSPFAKLPGEIRNKIYEPVLYQRNGIHMQKHASSNGLIYSRPSTRAGAKNSVQRGANVLAMAQTCKELRQECQALFFNLNTFHLKVVVWCGSGVWSQQQRYVYRAHLNACKRWLLQIGPENAKAIQRLVIEGPFLRLFDARVHPNREPWWKSAREIERQVFRSMLAPPTIYTSFTYDFGKALATFVPGSSQRICDTTGLTDSSGVGKISLTLPTSNKALAIEELMRKFTAKQEILRSHHRHKCVIDGNRRELLRALERSLEFTLDALEEG
jgi:hypothetical protein